MINKNTISKLVFSLIYVLIYSNSYADTFTNDISTHGYISQTAIHSSSYDFYSESEDDIGFGHYEAALGVGYEINDWLYFATQVASRKSGEVYDDDYRVDHLVLDAEIKNCEKGFFNVRIGRGKIPIGLYNESRDNPYTRPGIFIPDSVYDDTRGTRYLYRDLDGVVLSHTHLLDSDILKYSLAYFTSGDVEPSAQFSLFRNAFIPGELTVNDSTLLDVKYKTNSNTTLGLSYLHTSVDFESATPFNTDADTAIDSLTLSYQHKRHTWSVASEAVIRQVEVDSLGVDFIDTQRHEVGFYIQGDYFITSNLSFYLRYSQFWEDFSDRSGNDASQELTQYVYDTGPAVPNYEAIIEEGVNSHRFYQINRVIGFQWENNDTWQLRGEYHNITGTAHVSSEDNPEIVIFGGSDKNWGKVALQATYLF